MQVSRPGAKVETCRNQASVPTFTSYVVFRCVWSEKAWSQMSLLWFLDFSPVLRILAGPRPLSLSRNLPWCYLFAGSGSGTQSSSSKGEKAGTSGTLGHPGSYFLERNQDKFASFLQYNQTLCQDMGCKRLTRVPTRIKACFEAFSPQAQRAIQRASLSIILGQVVVKSGRLQRTIECSLAPETAN